MRPLSHPVVINPENSIQYRATLTIGGLGVGVDKFEHPSDIFIDHFNYLWIADTGNRRILKLTNEGVVVSIFRMGDELFERPTGVCCWKDWFYVADHARGKISQFTRRGKFLTNRPEGLKETEGEAYFKGVSDIAIWEGKVYWVEGDRGICIKDGFLFLSDFDRVQKFSLPDMRLVLEFGKWGRRPGRFRTPQGIDVDTEGCIYVCDTLNHRVQKFSPDGVFLTSFGRYGRGLGELDTPVSLAVGHRGEVWVVEAGNHRIQKFVPEIRAVALDEDDYPYLYSEARRAETLGKYYHAIAYYKRCTELVELRPPEAALCWLRMGDCWRKAGDLEQAVGVYSKVVERHPGSPFAPEAMLQKANLLYKMGIKEDALMVYKDLITRYPEAPQVRQAERYIRYIKERE
jgi:hypothetical protein